MDIHEFDILLRSPIPQDMCALFELDDSLGFSLDITALDGIKGVFKLIKRYDRPNGQEAMTSIVISTEQWQKMKDYHDSIMELMINDLMSHVEFKTHFLTWSKICHFEGELKKSIPETWDVTCATMHITGMIKTVVMDLLVEKGNLIMPECGVGDVISSNDMKDFNSAVKDLNMYSVMQNFYDKVTNQTENEDFLLRKLIDYVTVDFLNDIDFSRLICEVRKQMCPPIGMTSICV